MLGERERERLSELKGCFSLSHSLFACCCRVLCVLMSGVCIDGSVVVIVVELAPSVALLADARAAAAAAAADAQATARQLTHKHMHTRTQRECTHSERTHTQLETRRRK